LNFENLIFEFVSDFVLRISNFMMSNLRNDLLVELWYDVYRRRRESLILKDDIQVTEGYLVFIVQIMFDTGG
jgi:hypothetical protein